MNNGCARGGNAVETSDILPIPTTAHDLDPPGEADSFLICIVSSVLDEIRAYLGIDSPQSQGNFW